MIENHVVSLEEAKLLAPLLPEGFKSEFVWNGDVLCKALPDGTLVSTQSGKKMLVFQYMVYPAPILSEVLEVLPEQIAEYHFSLTHNNIGYLYGERVLVYFEITTNPATAASMLLRRVKESGYV